MPASKQSRNKAPVAKTIGKRHFKESGSTSGRALGWFCRVKMQWPTRFGWHTTSVSDSVKLSHARQLTGGGLAFR